MGYRGFVLNQARTVTLVITAMAASYCGGTRGTPTSPTSPTTGASIPVVRSVTVNRTNIEAGDEITISASIDGSAAPGQLRYIWSVEPNAGVLNANGPTLVWQAPSHDPVPATYVFSVTLAAASDTTAFGATAATSSRNAAASSPPVIVNDARRETISQSEAFLKDAADTSVAPDICVRNFTQSCDGTRTVLAQLQSDRTTYSEGSVKYDLQLFVRSIEWPNCVAPDGSARCTLLIYDVEWLRTRKSDNVQERVTGTEYVQGFYERNRWWLCGARFEAP